jgi:chaperonin GroES
MSLSTEKINLIRPLHDRVLIKRDEEVSSSTPGGIIIPDQAKERAQIGTVIAIGTGKMLNNGAIQSIIVKKGDTVFFGKYAGTEVSEDYIILREDEILAIL